MGKRLAGTLLAVVLLISFGAERHTVRNIRWTYPA